MNQIGFGKKLRELRDSKEESQIELGALLSVGEKQIQRYEGGEVLPTHENLVKLCRHYKYDFISLLYEIDKTSNSDSVYYNKYISLLEKSDLRSERIIEQQEEDLKALRSAVNKITSVDHKLGKMEVTVDALQGKWKEYEPTILGLREFVIDEIVSLKKQSREQVGAALNIKVEEQRKAVEQSYTQKD
jgi:transcriptional regulator with XRE-family HTH domain